METKFIDIDDHWGIIVVYDYSAEDKKEMAGIMDSFGMEPHDIHKSLDILSHYNTGMSISRDDVRMSCIFVSRCTHPSEFWNTLIHEVTHVADAIIEYYGVKWYGEDAAYLTGFITKRMVEELGVPCY